MGVRKTFIVDRSFQFSFIFQSILLLVLTFSMVIIAISLWEKRDVKQGYLLLLPKESEVRTIAQNHGISPDSAAYAQLFFTRAKMYTFLDILWKPMLAVFLINILLMVVANTYYSHRIAGPMVRVKKALRQKLDGQEVAPMKVRANDEFRELVVLVNQLLVKKVPPLAAPAAPPQE